MVTLLPWVHGPRRSYTRWDTKASAGVARAEEEPAALCSHCRKPTLQLRDSEDQQGVFDRGASDGGVAKGRHRDTLQLLDAVGDRAAFLDIAPGEGELAALRRHERTGRPFGDAGFVTDLEQRLGRRLRPGRRGRRPTVAGNEQG